MGFCLTESIGLLAAIHPIAWLSLFGSDPAMLSVGALSRDEMAAALGYSDATSFSRACRRWFGSERAGE